MTNALKAFNSRGSFLLSALLLAVLLFVLLFTADIAKATENKIATSNNATTLPGPPVGAGELANITLGLMAVLALIFALAWLYRRYGNLPAFNRSNIQLIGGVSLGTREKAVLLEVEGTRVLVGVTSNQITPLHVFPPGCTAIDEQPKASEEISENTPDATGFAQTLENETRVQREKA